MSPIFLDAIALTYRPDMDVLFLRWPQPVYALTPREVYTQVLELAQETKARFWLFDVRSRGPLSEEDMQWVKEFFYPSLNKHLEKTIHVAYLLSPAHAEDPVAVGHVKDIRTKDWHGHQSTLEGFTSETDALNWLKRCQLAQVVK